MRRTAPSCLAAAEPWPDARALRLCLEVEHVVHRVRRQRANPSSSGRGRLTASSTQCSKTGIADFGPRAQRSLHRRAARRARSGTARRSCPASRPPLLRGPLCTCCPRDPARDGTRSSPSRASYLVSMGSRPMSATTTSPAWNRPGATSWPTLRPWKVTLRSARTATPTPRRSRHRPPRRCRPTRPSRRNR